MKYFYIIICLSIFSSLYAQDCGPITAGSSFVHDHFKYNILKGDEAFNELYYKVGIGPDGDMDSREYARIIYSNNIWIGAKDSDGQTRLSAGTYNEQDWTTGPLDMEGETTTAICESWNQVFTVTREEIMKARQVYLDEGPCDDIPLSIRQWPARGNPLSAIQLPDQLLANFFDWDGTATYNPCNGDLPSVTIRGKEPVSLADYFAKLPAQISYYMINDAGSTPSLSGGEPLNIRIGVYVFTYKTEEAKDVIYIKYKTFDHSNSDFTDFRFGNWFDFDLGCSDNDLVGTDTDRNMVYVYNSSTDKLCNDGKEGIPGSLFGVSNLGGVFESYKIVDNGGIDSIVLATEATDIDTIIRKKMDSSIIPVDCQTDPLNTACYISTPDEFYNVLLGKYKDGSPVLDNNGAETQKMYTGRPNNPEGWSLCNESSFPETTAIIASGTKNNFRDSSNEILLAFCYANDSDEGCPSITALQHKQEEAQKFYEDGFYHQVGPPPPVLSMEQSALGINISVLYFPDNYSEKIPKAVEAGYDDSTYEFEGIKIFQVKSENFDMTELYNTDVSRLVYQGDISNDIEDISNWNTSFESGIKNISQVQQVDGSNLGIDDEILFDTDLFTNEPVELGNSYYFVAISYAYNNYLDYDPTEEEGQRHLYLEGRCGLKTLNSQVLLSNEEITVEKPYNFEMNGQSWSLKNKRDELTVNLIASNGQRIKEWKLNPGHTIHSTSLSDLPSGLYFIQIYNPVTNQMFAHKVVSTR